MLRLASEHELVPLLWAGLPVSGVPTPPAVRALLEAGYRASRLRAQSWQEPTVRQSLGILADLGLEPIVLKGAALAYTAYPEPWLRTMADLDLLLPPEDLGRASAELTRAGFRTLNDDPLPSHHLRLHYAPGGRSAVELHGHIVPEPGPYRIDVEALRAQAVPATIAGVPVRVLAPADAVHFACLHLAFTHRYHWYVLRGLTDVLAITGRCAGDLDWSLFLERVRRSRTAGATYWPLWLSRAWLGAPVPDWVLSALAPTRLARRFLADAFEPQRVLGARPMPETSDEVLAAGLVELSLYTGCSLSTQAAALGRVLFPQPSGVTHLPPGGDRLSRALRGGDRKPQAGSPGLAGVTPTCGPRRQVKSVRTATRTATSTATSAYDATTPYQHTAAARLFPPCGARRDLRG